MLVAPPDSELVEAWVCDWRDTVVEKAGAQFDRASATPVSWMLRIEALNADAQVLFHRELDRFVD